MPGRTRPLVDASAREPGLQHRTTQRDAVIGRDRVSMSQRVGVHGVLTVRIEHAQISPLADGYPSPVAEARERRGPFGHPPAQLH